MVIESQECFGACLDVADRLECLECFWPHRGKELGELVIIVFGDPGIDHKRSKLWTMVVDGRVDQFIL